VALLGYNIGQIPIDNAIRSFVLTLFLSITILFLARLFLKDWQKAGLFSSFFIIPFFSYGHIYNTLTQISSIGGILGRHRILIPLFIFLIVLGLWWTLKIVRDWDTLTSALNLVSLALLILPIYQITTYFIHTQAEEKATFEGAEDVFDQFSNQKRELPDIYYILTDSYTRQDILLEKYGFDNAPFIDKLRSFGFFVDNCGQSNYSLTPFSVASSLNLDYVNALGDDDLFYLDPEGRPDPIKFGNLIRQNKARSFLEYFGYKTIAFETGYNWLNWTEADLYLHRFYDAPISLRESIFFGTLNEFEVLLMKTSLGLALIDMGVILEQDGITENFFVPADVKIGARRGKYARAIYTLGTLEEIVELESPKFVFGYIHPPHKPYVITSDGQYYENDAQDETGYVKEVTFLNDRLSKIIERIITNSKQPPIIILQGDHGAAESVGDISRVYILNALYFPKGGSDLLYPSITPVNSFRLMFDHYFGSNLGLLEDISFNHQPYRRKSGNQINFDIVPNLCK